MCTLFVDVVVVEFDHGTSSPGECVVQSADVAVEFVLGDGEEGGVGRREVGRSAGLR